LKEQVGRGFGSLAVDNRHLESNAIEVDRTTRSRDIVIWNFQDSWFQWRYYWCPEVWIHYPRGPLRHST